MQYFTLLISIVLLSSQTHAQVYRCMVNQQTVYQDHPCGSTNTAIAPMINQSGGLRDSEKTWIKQNHSKRFTPKNKLVNRREKDTESKACWKKRQQLKEVKRQLKQGYKASEGDKLKRERAKYQDFLKQFCRK